jgi:hypothetical protein
MRRTLLILSAAAGALVGAALMHAVDRAEPRIPTLTPGPADEGSGPALENTAPADTTGSTTAERADLYRVAAAADSKTLADMIRAAEERPPSAARRFALEVLLTRFAELDPAAAVAAAADLEPDLRAPLYGAWATKDPAAALDALAKISDRAAARVIAAALVTALGGDDRALREVAAAVPAGVESSVYADAITARASSAPEAALDQALALTDSAARSLALQGIAAAWAERDPAAALTAADKLTDLERSSFITSIARDWARLDPDATLAYLISVDGNRLDVLAALGSQLAQLRPRKILALDRIGNTAMGLSLRMVAIQTLANQDPDQALHEAESLPLGGQRESALSVIARSYGARDPDAALAWARASGDQKRIVGVLAGVAQRDPMRAMELAVALDTPQLRAQAVQTISISAGASPDRARELADRVLALPDPALRSTALRSLLGMWANSAPEAAVDWLVAHDIDAQGTYMQLGQQLARSNPARAAELTARVPSAARSEWIQGVAIAYAQSDPQGAVAWLAQYRGDPAYSRAVGPVAAGLAASDPAGAARLLATASDQPAAESASYASVVGNRWAQQDPPAAAAWAKDYDANLSQPIVVPRVVSSWAQTDAASARSWTLRLPSGQARDAALTALLTATPTATVDSTLLDAFSSEPARNQAIVNMARVLAGRDRAAATQLIDNYVTDENLRDQAKRNLERLPPGVTIQYNAPPIF